jgi:hypothetical protein
MPGPGGWETLSQNTEHNKQTGKRNVQQTSPTASKQLVSRFAGAHWANVGLICCSLHHKWVCSSDLVHDCRSREAQFMNAESYLHRSMQIHGVHPHRISMYLSSCRRREAQFMIAETHLDRSMQIHGVHTHRIWMYLSSCRRREATNHQFWPQPPSKHANSPRCW